MSEEEKPAEKPADPPFDFDKLVDAMGSRVDKAMGALETKFEERFKELEKATNKVSDPPMTDTNKDDKVKFTGKIPEKLSGFKEGEIEAAVESGQLTMARLGKMTEEHYKEMVGGN